MLNKILKAIKSWFVTPSLATEFETIIEDEKKVSSEIIEEVKEKVVKVTKKVKAKK